MSSKPNGATTRLPSGPDPHEQRKEDQQRVDLLDQVLSLRKQLDHQDKRAGELERTIAFERDQREREVKDWQARLARSQEVEDHQKQRLPDLYAELLWMLSLTLGPIFFASIGCSNILYSSSGGASSFQAQPASQHLSLEYLCLTLIGLLGVFLLWSGSEYVGLCLDGRVGRPRLVSLVSMAVLVLLAFALRGNLANSATIGLLDYVGLILSLLVCGAVWLVLLDGEEEIFHNSSADKFLPALCLLTLITVLATFKLVPPDGSTLFDAGRIGGIGLLFFKAYRRHDGFGKRRAQ